MGSIIAAVVNSMQEAQMLINLLYMPMLMLSGATFPITGLPEWVQTIAQFLPSAYFMTGVQGILRGRETFLDNLTSARALADYDCRRYPTRVQALPLGKRRKDEALGQALAGRRTWYPSW